jgi:hypothetical protein
MKLSYERTLSDKNSMGRIDTRRFKSEVEIDTFDVDEIIKQKRMKQAVKDLHIAEAIMLDTIVLQDEDGK